MTGTGDRTRASSLEIPLQAFDRESYQIISYHGSRLNLEGVG